MTKSLENVERTKSELKTKTVSNSDSEKRIEQLAEEVAEKATHTEQKYDNDHQIFSK